MNRRRFPISLAATSAALCAPTVTRADDGHYDVSYIWTSERSEALDYLAQLKGLLGVEVSTHLELVLNEDELYGVVYNLRRGSKADATALADRHDAILREALDSDVPLAMRLPDSAYARLYNVSYGLGPNIQERNNAIVFGATSKGAPPPPDPEPVAAVEESPRRSRSARRRKRDEAEAWAQLKTDINSHIQTHRRGGRVTRDEVTSWLVYDLKNDRLLASIHEDKSRQCASMVKPFVALAFFHEASRGRYIYGPKSNSKFTAMIQHSSNSATNWVFEQLGGASATDRLLKKHYGHIFKNTSIVENISAGGRTYRNRASAGDYCRFLRALWHDELPYSAELKRLMNLPGRDRLYYGAPHIPVGTEIYNKTAEDARFLTSWSASSRSPAGPAATPRGSTPEARSFGASLIWSTSASRTTSPSAEGGRAAALWA